MSHRCVYVKDGQQCGFRLPDSYPLPVCPWHFADQVEEKYKLAALAAGIAVGVGVVLVAKIAPGIMRRLQEKLEPREDIQHDYGEAAPNVIDFQEAVNRRRQAGMVESDEVPAGESDESRERWSPPRRCPHGVPLGRACAECVGQEKFKEGHGDWRVD